MVGTRFLTLVFCSALLLTHGPFPSAAHAGEKPGWMKALQEQMEALQQQAGGARPERPDSPAAQEAAAEAGVTLAISGAEAALLPLISVFLEDAETGQRLHLTRKGNLFQGGPGPGLYILKARVPGLVPFEVKFDSIRLQAGASIHKKLDLKAMLASLRIEAADPQLLQGASLWIYRAQGAADQPLAQIKVHGNQPIEGVPAGRLRIVLRDAKGAAFFQQSIRPFPGEEFLVSIKEARPSEEAHLLRLWVRNQTKEPFPDDLQAEVFDREGKRVAGLAQVNDYKFTASLLPGIYTLKVKSAARRRPQESEVVVGDHGRVTDVVARLERNRLDFCSESAVARSEAFYRAGSRQESGGDPAQALLFYNAADRCLKSEAAREALQRVGRELGQQAEARGHYYSEDFYRTTQDERCASPSEDLFCTPEGELVQFDTKAPAVAWYTVSHNDELAAQAMLRYAKELPIDGAATFQKIARYFARDAKKVQALKEIAVAHGRAALDEEEKVFVGSPPGGTAHVLSRPTEETSLELLEHARQWYGMASQGEKVMSRADQRGDSVMAAPHPAPRHLEAAQRYYQLAGTFKKIQQVQTAAAQAGERAAGRGEYQLAARFFTVAGNDQRADAMARRDEQGLEQEMQQRAEERETFEKGADALENELGI